jgi:hypothetical protein
MSTRPTTNKWEIVERMKSRGKYQSTLVEFIETVTIASTKRRAETLTFSKQKLPTSYASRNKMEQVSKF